MPLTPVASNDIVVTCHGSTALMSRGPGGSTPNTPVPVAQNLLGGTVGIAYTEQISAQGGTAPYTFTISAGSLPTGTSMNSAGLITGTPTIAGSYTFTVKVTDVNGSTGTHQFNIAIASPAGGGGITGWVE